MNESKQRLYTIDNIKGILMISVVLMHLYLRITTPLSNYIYILTELFCMPMWVFISGYCNKNNETFRSIIKNFLYPYLLWQCIYILFVNFATSTYTSFQFLQPYWLLWYFLSLFFWHLMIKIFKTKDRKQQLFYILLFIILGLAIGYWNFNSKILSISRTIVFFPFYLWGYYCKESNIFDIKNKNIKICIYSFFFIILAITFVFIDCIKVDWLFHTVPYAIEIYEYNPLIRLAILTVNAIFVLFLCVSIPNRQIYGITTFGQNTMPIYVLHGFVMLFIFSRPEIICFLDKYYMLLYPLTIILVILLGNKQMNNYVNLFVYLPFNTANYIKNKFYYKKRPF